MPMGTRVALVAVAIALAGLLLMRVGAKAPCSKDALFHLKNTSFDCKAGKDSPT